MNTSLPNSTPINNLNEQLNPVQQQAASLELRDIHLPDAISWWPLAPGWWISACIIIVGILIFFIVKEIIKSRQLKRDIASELQTIKITFQQDNDRYKLVTSLSILLRRASISYFQSSNKQNRQQSNIAGLTGDDWLKWLDETSTTGKAGLFQSEIGKVLISAPYLPKDATPDFDTTQLIGLCETWLTSSHYKQVKNS